ncbi:MAG: hypothetical protein LBN07_02435 [Christensenellaceae bacterium]|jgi:hypothetical protein|nr:hypothetical protein [Christensenellaceae bacterium]
MKEEEYEQLNMGFEKLESQTEVVMTANRLDLKEALLKRAVGYVSEEQVDEYALDALGGKLKLIKRKVIHKEVPPDVMAAKVLMDVYNIDAIRRMSDEELEQEKNRLLILLKQEEEIKGGENVDRE